MEDGSGASPFWGGVSYPPRRGQFLEKKTHAHIQIRDSRSIVLSRMRATGLTFFLKHLLGMASYFYPKRPNDDKKSAFDCRPRSANGGQIFHQCAGDILRQKCGNTGRFPGFSILSMLIFHW